jgi:hypothetical protein
MSADKVVPVLRLLARRINVRKTHALRLGNCVITRMA